MLEKVSKYLLSGVLVMLCSVSTAVSAVEGIDSFLIDAFDFGSPVVITDDSTTDNEITQTQMLAPQSPRSPRMAQRPPRPASSRRRSNLSSVPFMIGDTGAGSCVSYGDFLDVDLGHPTLSCSRLNISEANTPLPIDRLYYSFRHFHNATQVQVDLFNFAQDFDINRHNLGGERTFFNKMLSFELRVPVEERLNSQTGTYSVNAGSPLGAPGFDPFFGFNSDTQVELANISMIFKALLMERKHFALSAGLGVTLPTARDVTFDATVDSLVPPSDTSPLAYYQLRISAISSNETIYLAPFLAWLYQKNDRWFHQGFLQVEVAANDSFFTAGGFGFTRFDTSGNGIVDPFDPADEFFDFITPVPLGIAELQPQTLLRLNLGWGYVLHENSQADWIQKLTGLFEIHYTTTLNKAKISEIPLFFNTNTFTGFGLDSIDVGNENNRVDLLNVVTGLSVNVGNWIVTNGVSAPVRTGSDRGFDFEYNLQLQRPF